MVELLVVISIISLLASVVLAALNSARDKGRLAAAKQFSAIVDHAEGDQAVGLWDFSECSGATTYDRSGLGNNGSITGTTAWSTDTPFNIGCSLSFDGTSPVSAGTSDLGITNQITISAWIKATSTSPYAGIVTKASPTMGSWKLDMSGTTGVRFDVFSAATAYNALPATLTLDGQWHNVVGTYDGATMSIYIDGTLRGSTPYAGGVYSSTATIQIGNDGCCGTRIWTGLIDSVHIFAKNLSASEVGRLYASESVRRFADTR